MATPFLIIDGYNLMHAWGLARQRYGPGDLERLRERFLRQLANRLTDEERGRTTVVFDSGTAAQADTVGRQRFQGMEIDFAQGDPDADTRIERLIARHSAPRQIRVVSSDKRLQTAARRRRGNFVTSERFLKELERAELASDEPALSRELEAKSTGVITENEMAEWLEIFGEAEDQ